MSYESIIIVAYHRCRNLHLVTLLHLLLVNHLTRTSPKTPGPPVSTLMDGTGEPCRRGSQWFPAWTLHAQRWPMTDHESRDWPAHDLPSCCRAKPRRQRHVTLSREALTTATRVEVATRSVVDTLVSTPAVVHGTPSMHRCTMQHQRNAILIRRLRQRRAVWIGLWIIILNVFRLPQTVADPIHISRRDATRSSTMSRRRRRVVRCRAGSCVKNPYGPDTRANTSRHASWQMSARNVGSRFSAFNSHYDSLLTHRNIPDGKYISLLSVISQRKLVSINWKLK